jgi:hypothetical protein
MMLFRVGVVCVGTGLKKVEEDNEDFEDCAVMVVLVGSLKT